MLKIKNVARNKLGGQQNSNNNDRVKMPPKIQIAAFNRKCCAFCVCH